MHPANQDFINRLRAQVGSARDLTQMPEWIIQNTTNPADSTKAWSFDEHEYQIPILRDTSPEVVMQKCSQVGASEIWLRKALALMMLSKQTTMIYILPTISLLQKVSRGRLKPIIEQSPAVMRALDKKNDSVVMKRISNSWIYFSGSFGQSSAISVPAQALFMDEVDFCNQRALTTYYSRIGHSKEGESLIRKFSTPTVFDFGINKEFKEGHQAYYCVKCPACFEWGRLDYENNVEIPGFDGNLSTLDKEDLYNSDVKVMEAFIRCEHCHAPIPSSALCDPQMRQYIPLRPDVVKHSYQVFPQDVPTINTLPRTIRQIGDYDRVKDYWNFKIGLPYEDAATAFNEKILRMNAVSEVGYSRPTDDDTVPLANGCVMGVDVGKTCWITIGVPNDRHGVDIIYAERVKIDGNNGAGIRIMKLFKLFGCISGVIDAAPDISLAGYCVSEGRGLFWACRYVEKIGNTLDTLRLIDEEGVVLAARTPQFDGLVGRFNKGQNRLNDFSPEFELIIKHLKVLKRIQMLDDDGDSVEQWISTSSDDHYGHSIQYCNLNMQIVTARVPEHDVLPFRPTVSKVAWGADEDDHSTFESKFATFLQRHR